MSSLFKNLENNFADSRDQIRSPLADQIRPVKMDDVLGQEHLIGHNSPVSSMIETGKISSMILWGPPGSGKTTMARLFKNHFDLRFESISAVFSGVSDLKKLFFAARERLKKGQGTLIFVDEIHRFNRAQQDAFLPVVEDGTIILIGATTENPSFEINAALLSRCKVFVLKRLDANSLKKLLLRAEKETGISLPLTDESRELLIRMSDGDGRYIISIVESLVSQFSSSTTLGPEELENFIQRRSSLYDKNRELHYNLISAIHKSLRGSDPDAALYWVSRMIQGGEDPRYIFRRLARFALEDIGLADPNAISHSITAWDAYERLGSPEGDLALTQLVLYLGTAPKSNSVYKAYLHAKDSAKSNGSMLPPKHILNASTALLKNLGYSENYIYDHNTKLSFSGQNYFPENMSRQSYYLPNSEGYEIEIKKRLLYWNKIRKSLNKDSK